MPNMDLVGLVNEILFSAENIDLGRKNLAADGREHEGRLFYEDGISIALNTGFKASLRILFTLPVSPTVQGFTISSVRRGLT
jgi:hypothetical protein